MRRRGKFSRQKEIYDWSPSAAVSATLATLFDRVISVDPHLHRVSSLSEVVPGRQAVTLSASTAIGRFLRRRAAGALLVGPDEESAQWVRSAADTAGLEWAVGRKVRRGDRHVAVTLRASMSRPRMRSSPKTRRAYS